MRRRASRPSRPLAALAVTGLLLTAAACGEDDGPDGVPNTVDLGDDGRPAEVPDTIDVGNGGVQEPAEGPGTAIPDPMSPQPTLAPGQDPGTPVAPDPAGG